MLYCSSSTVALIRAPHQVTVRKMKPPYERSEWPPYERSACWQVTVRKMKLRTAAGTASGVDEHGGTVWTHT